MPNLANNKNFHRHVGRLPTADVPDCTAALRAIRSLANTDAQVQVCVDRAEAVASVLYGHLMESEGKNHILTTNVEDATAILTLQRLEKLGGFGKKVSVNEKGFISASDVERYITPRTGLVSLSWGCALTGVIHPIASIVKVCKKHGVPLHVDATHVCGKLQISMEDIDYLNVEGVLFGDVEALVQGRADDPKGILDAGRWAQEAVDNLDHVAIEGARLCAQFERAIQNKIPGAEVLYQDSERIPGISCINFPGVSSELMAFYLHHRGVDVAFGGGSFQYIAHVLKGVGAQSALSFCLDDDPLEIVDIVENVYADLQAGVI